MAQKTATVVVLGDIGRSPRMQFHTISLLESEFYVNLIGYTESRIMTEIAGDSKVKIHSIRPFPELELPTLLKYILKTLWTSWLLFVALFRCLILAKSDVLLCQNPPAIPTLFVCFLLCRLGRCRFVVDWHNYSFTIMALQSRPESAIVRFSKRLEVFFGRKSDANFCVSKAMQADLKEKFGIEAAVLYDRPPAQFHPISLEEKHKFFLKLGKIYPEFKGEGESTAFTESRNGKVTLKADRPGLLISSTSWTPDEDFNILLEALESYEKSDLPPLICAITGKGPLKEFFQALISRREWQRVKIITPWLEIEDYPTLLASGDLGVCLHYSSSGLDLPMKVIDMFGSGLPVCAVNFNCLSELVQDGRNGFIFESSEQLADLLKRWFTDFPNNSEVNRQKSEFERNLKQFQALRWEQNWNIVARPVLD